MAERAIPRLPSVGLPGVDRLREAMNPFEVIRQADNALDAALVTGENARMFAEAQALRVRSLVADAAFLSLSLEQKERALDLLKADKRGGVNG